MKRGRVLKRNMLWFLCMLMFLISLCGFIANATENGGDTTFVPVTPSNPTVNISYVDPININITAPEIGMNPDFGYVAKERTYTAYISDWKEKVNGNESSYGIPLTENDRFEAGKTYTVYISLEAIQPYQFHTSQERKEVFLASSRINGMQPRCDGYSDTFMVLMVDFTLDAYLTGVDITITEPMEGLTPSDTKATVNKGACTAEILTWMKKEGSNYNGLVGEKEKFEARKTYSAYVAIYPNNGFRVNVSENGRNTFLKASKVNGITPYVGGPFSGWTKNGSEFIFQVDLKAKEKEPTVISGIDITLTVPVGGQKPNFKATVKKGACTAYVADWKVKNGASLEENDSFVSGKTYTAYVWVEAKDGYKFNVTYTGRKNLLKNSKINGFTPSMYGYSDSGSSVTFMVNIMAEEAVNTIIKEKQTKASYKIVKLKSGEKTALFLKPQNTKVKKAVIPSTVTLNGITYKVTGIANNAFKNCKYLTSVTIGENVTSIGKSAFSGCVKLKAVHFGKKLAVIDEAAFYGCKVLTKANLPVSMISIGKSAFSGCTKLKSVTLGKNVTTIGDKAFYKCKALTKAVIPLKVTRIGKAVFYNCTKLKSITLGGNVTVIDEQAFYKCTALTKITVPAKVEKIGKQAFYGCKKLKSIVLQTAKLSTGNVGEKAFSGIYSKASIKVPANQLDNYKKLLRKKGAGKKVKFGK